MEFEAILLLILLALPLGHGRTPGRTQRQAFLRPDRKYRWFV